jgi:hypothetical protein
MSTEHYHGSCQCGAVSFEVDADLDRTVACNCSRCKRLGSVLTFVPKDQFTLLSGEGHLTEYLFNKKQIQHLFCGDCGVESFSYANAPDGTPMVAVNANCLDGVDARSLKPHAYDGASA